MFPSKLLNLAVGGLLFAQTAGAALTDGLVAYYNFDSDFNNQLSGSYNGTATGAVIVGGAGLVGGAADLNAAGDRITMGTLGTSALGNSFTISGWYLFDPTTAGGRRMYLWEASNNYDVSFGTGTNVTAPPGNVAFDTYYNQGSFKSTSVDISGGAWKHFVQTFDYNGSNQLTVNTYVNGSLVSGLSSVVTISNPPNDLASFSGLVLGNARSGSQTRGLDGKIDEVAVWARALSAGEVTSLYNQGLAGTPVPEPSTYGLLGAGALAGIAFIRRRRRA